MTCRDSLLRHLDKLACPDCVAAGSGEAGLLLETEALRCLRCGRSHPIVQGIPDLRPASLAERDERRGKALVFYETQYAQGTYGREDQDVHVGPLRRWLEAVPEDALVLEVGVGRGALQGLHPGYVALDLSLEALVRHVRWPAVAADSHFLPFRNECVRFVYTIATLEHVPSPERALREIARVLVPGGVAYLAPAWHCRPWAAQGLHVRPYRDLSLNQKLVKMTIPLRDSLAWRGAFAIPRRLARRLAWRVTGRPTRFRYGKLEANLEVFWASDSDATAHLDPHETALYFESRGWKVLSPASAPARVFHRSDPLVVYKSPRAATAAQP